jgi:hypothetical protein
MESYGYAIDREKIDELMSIDRRYGLFRKKDLLSDAMSHSTNTSLPSEDRTVSSMEVDRITALLHNNKKAEITTKTLQLDPHQPKTLSSLMMYLSEESLNKIQLTEEELLRELGDKAQPLVDEFEECTPHCAIISRFYVAHMILELLMHDKAGIKLSDMSDRVKQLYYWDPNYSLLVDKVNNDYTNTDNINEKISERC